jgi:hypothetical protein
MLCSWPGNCTAVCLVALLAVACPPALSADKADEAEKTLRQQRRDALQEVVKARQQEVGAGRATVGNLIEPARQLFLAELEMAAKPADRLALCEKFAQVVKECRERNEERHKAGRVSDGDYALARADCLEGDVLLLRERLRAREDKEEGPKLLRKLLLERREAYQAALLDLSGQYDIGFGSLTLLLDVNLRSLAADLETESKPTARDALREATANRLAQREEKSRVMFELGRASLVDHVAVRVARLAVEIDRDREKFGVGGERLEKRKGLLEARRDDARNALERRREQFEFGRGSQELLDAARIALEAELALSQKAADRVPVLRAHLETLRKVEKEVKSRLDAGRAEPIELWSARAARLEAEINLRRTERAAKGEK